MTGFCSPFAGGRPASRADAAQLSCTARLATRPFAVGDACPRSAHGFAAAPRAVFLPAKQQHIAARRVPAAFRSAAQRFHVATQRLVERAVQQCGDASDGTLAVTPMRMGLTDLLRSVPIGLYLEQPRSFLHGLDPRVKLLWLMSFVLCLIRASPWWHIYLVPFVAFLMISALPARVWRSQLLWTLFLGLGIFSFTAFTPDALPATPPELLAKQPWLGNSYKYGIISMTGRSLDLGIRSGVLPFILLTTANMFLLTTAPEEMVAAFEWALKPLARFGFPVEEVCLTLTLAIRFNHLVLEEIQNLAKAVLTRGINWKKMGLFQSLKVWPTVGERLLRNLLGRAEPIAASMCVRGFTSPEEHKLKWHEFHFGTQDRIALAALAALWACRFIVQ
eukprot:tig00000383_g24638.t1